MPTVVALNQKSGIQKGPATDASMITAMKRQNAIVSQARQIDAPPFRDHMLTRGFEASGVREFYAKRGSQLSFLRVL